MMALAEHTADFAQQAHDALAHLHDPVALQTHPLARQLCQQEPPVPASRAGRELRQRLLDAIAALRPAAKTSEISSAWRGYRLLELRYVEALEPAAVQEQLGISRAQYYRDHARAMAALVGMLCERWDAAGTPTIAPPANTAVERPPATSQRRTATLPRQLTSFVGREREVATVTQLLAAVPLVTLTGPGGVGKTRLALRVAEGEAGSFEHGACFVSLAHIRNPTLVPPAIAQALEVRFADGPSLPGRLIRYLRHKQLLLILDNFEQVRASAPFIGDVLAACPEVSVLVTSRAPLHLQGEHEYPVPPLALPDPAAVPAVERLAECDAVRLFVQRARSVSPDFALTSGNAAAVAGICHRLDGLPLGIELAAARVKLLPPPALLARSAARLPLLTGGARDLPARHRTLRQAIDWSHGLLGEAEQVLFRRLAVFVGGWTLPDAEAVCAGEAVVGGRVGDTSTPLGQRAPSLALRAEEVLDVLASLVDNNLVVPAEAIHGEPGFRMLETIREFALERLAESGEATFINRRHAAYYVAQAAQAAQRLRQPGQMPWLDWLEAEYQNLRAALEWCRAAADGGDAGVQMGLRLVAALWWLWYCRCHFEEGRGWLAAFLERPDVAGAAGTPGDAHRLRAVAEAHCGAGALAFRQSDYDEARRHLDLSVSLWQQIGSKQGLASALIFLGVADFLRGDYSTARTRLDASVRLFREVDDRWGLAYALNPLGRVLLLQGRDLAVARSHFEESLALFRQMQDDWGLQLVLQNLGDLHRQQGSYVAARQYYEHVVRLGGTASDRWIAIQALVGLGRIAQLQGSNTEALLHYREALRLCLELGSNTWVGICLSGLAGVAGALGQLACAARLFGAAHAASGGYAELTIPVDRIEQKRYLAMVRAVLGKADFAAAWAEGQAMTHERAVEYALTLSVPALYDATVSPVDRATAGVPGVAADRPHLRAGGGIDLLTPREREVAALIAQGSSNQDIADALVISRRTADTHVGNILNKLGFNSRAEVATWAVRHGLA